LQAGDCPIIVASLLPYLWSLLSHHCHLCCPFCQLPTSGGCTPPPPICCVLTTAELAITLAIADIIAITVTIVVTNAIAIAVALTLDVPVAIIVAIAVTLSQTQEWIALNLIVRFNTY
jgi:hypothetical protein